MTEPNLQDFFTPAAGHALSAGEKENIYHRLQGSVTAHPRPTDRAAGVGREPYQGSALWQSLNVLFRSWTPIAAVLVILFLTGAGVVVAENALPGDFLYPVKRIGERVRTTLSVSTGSQSSVETENLGRRLDEADALEAEGRLTQSAVVELDSAYRQERTEHEKTILKLESEGEANAAAQARAQLDAVEVRYERTLRDRLRPEDSDDSSGASSQDANIEADASGNGALDLDLGL